MKTVPQLSHHGFQALRIPLARLGLVVFLAAVSSLSLWADTVWVTRSREQADRIVYVTSLRGDAALTVYWTRNPRDARRCHACWYRARRQSEADYSVYFTKTRSEATQVIYLTSNRREAGQRMIPTLRKSKKTRWPGWSRTEPLVLPKHP